MKSMIEIFIIMWPTSRLKRRGRIKK